LDKDLVPWGFMTEAEVAEVVAKTIQFWKKRRAVRSGREEVAAQKPSLEEQIANLPPEKQAEVRRLLARAVGESLMKVRVATSDRREDDRVFEETLDESVGEWMEFLKNAAGPKR
jgi:hypothetical protein